MSGEFTVRHLRCGHCGTELPVMGRYITFQCETCFRYWIITGTGLEPLQVFRSPAPEDSEAETLLLPFWVILIDPHLLRNNVEQSVTNLQSLSATLSTTEITHETGDFDELVNELTGVDVASKRAELLHGISQARKVPSGSELTFLLDKIENHDRYSIFVPAFQTTNTFAYLKIGKLLTRKQPPFRLVRAEDPGRPVMCVLHPEEAVQLMDFIFISTLPESIQESGDFLKDVRLNAASPPRLVELPFEIRGSALYSIIGGFEISSRLIELPHADKHISSRS
ncbi:MAG: hypothetical protein KOO63_13885 [Bacteroidales bacterium]|nr:hypothetical protein [Candidatus Latescibacterota bacterium]